MPYSTWQYFGSLPTQYLNLTTTLLTINKQQIRILFFVVEAKLLVNSEYVFPNVKCKMENKEIIKKCVIRK